MRIRRVILLCIFVFFSGLALGQQISIQVVDEPLNEVLDQLAKKYDLKISYDSDELSEFIVTLELENEPLTLAFEKLLSPFYLKAKKSKGNFYYIFSTERNAVLLIQDSESKDPISFATIQILGTYKGNTTNISGISRLSFDQTNSILLINAFGYKTQEINPSEYPGDTINISMEINSLELETVTVLDYLNRGIRLKEDVSTPIIQISEMEVLPGLPEADVLLTTQMLPGWESSNENAADINVRGSDPSQTLIYWDRIPVYKAAHYFGQITSLIPGMANEVSAYKNYIPTSFSGATSGLLNIAAEDSINHDTRFTSNTTLTHTELTLKSGLSEKFSVQMGGRFSYNHIINTPLFNAYSNKLFEGFRDFEDDNQDDQLSELKFWDVNAKAIYQPDQKNYLSLSVLVNDDQMNYEGGESDENVESTQNHLETFRGANLLYTHQFNSNWTGSLSASISDYDAEDSSNNLFGDEELTDFDSSFISNQLNTIELKSGFVYKGWRNNRIEFGYQMHRYETSLQFNEWSEFEGSVDEQRTTRETANGFYAMGDLNMGSKWILRPQLRVDYFSNEEELVINPVLNTQYKLNDGLWLKASAGTYSQALSSLNDATISASNVTSSIWVLAGEEDTEVVKSQQFSLGFLYQRKGWIVDLDIYTKNVEGISAINLFESSVEEELDFELGTSNSSGLDLMVRKNFGRYNTWLSYTYSQTENTFDNIGQSFSSSLDRPHQFRWTHTYILNAFEFSLGWSFKSGAPYTQATQVGFEPEDDEYFLIYEPINSSRLPDYHRMDLSVWYRFAPKRGKWNGVAGLGLMNLYNRENIWKRFYLLEDMDNDDQPEIEIEERYFLGFTPSLTLQLNF